MTSAALSLQKSAIDGVFPGEGHRSQDPGSDGTIQGAQTAGRRPFVLEGTPISILGFDAPWHRYTDTSEVQVSAPLLKQPSSWDWSHRKMEKYLAQKHSVAWGIAQIAQSGGVTAEVLFTSGGSGRCFTLRPPTRSDVPLQWAHVGCGAITNDLADILCDEMTGGDLLRYFNDILGTNVSLDIPGMSNFLDEIRRSSHDFGAAYGKVRAWWAQPWSRDPIEALSEAMRYRNVSVNYERSVEMIRQDDVDAFSTKVSSIPPRRIWDLYSNRVLPYGDVLIRGILAGSHPPFDKFPDVLWTVSHSWVAAEARKSVWTPINGNQWPVPIPCATTLEHVRIELLNTGAEYVWPDVLCLRQQGRDEDEAVRIEEWKVDVPTIGYVYRGSPIYRPCATYFNGLGLPIDLTPDALASETHWLNRVWTLQETLPSWVPCGLTGRGPPASPGTTALFSQHAALLRRMEDNDTLVQELQRRACSSALDRIAGLAYVLGCATLPLYHAGADVEDAWHLLLQHAPGAWRLVVMCAHAADAPFALFPSWDAYIAGPTLRAPGLSPLLMGLELVNTELRRTDGPAQYRHWAQIFGPCRVVGTTAAGDGVQPRFEVHLSPGKGARAGVFTTRGAHGVLLEEIDYHLVLLDDSERDSDSFAEISHCIVVEVVAKGYKESSDRRSRAVEVIKWAVLKVERANVTGPRPDEVEEYTEVIYLREEEALRRTAYKERYMEAFRVMTERQDTLIISE
ncbi:hypothetical protein PsYK624_055220 [Phanerochaete sordida]|uniref:Heterokaryon incompatibility domain-containing protein n=1 Tax=Phanerochaete sordida TaxID=48140 RepID=A0A9P3G6Y1_9APHY|nr:hypothetical protein PsYK624_055220 [Phanerochaete sordida]